MNNMLLLLHETLNNILCFTRWN